MCRLALALLLAATSTLAQGGVDPAAEALEGTWLVSVTDRARDRFLIVSGARSERNRVHVATAVYGWIDGRGGEVGGWNAQVAGDTIRLTFVTPGDSFINVEFKAHESSVSGNFTRKDGKNFEVRMTRLPAEEMAALRAAAAASKKDKAEQKALADRTAKLRLLYVGAVDCPFCQYYESVYIRGGKMKEVFPALSEIEYVSINIGLFKMNRLKEHQLPDDLKWLLNNNPSPLRQRGVPYFAAISGSSILAQGMGETALWNLVAPALTKAVEARRSSN